MRDAFDRQLEEIQQIIRAGSIPEARRRILGLFGKRVERRHRVRLAYLANQISLNDKAVQLLSRIVRPSEGASDATEEERAEYGMALADLGAADEALAIFSKLDVERIPRIFRAYSLAHFRKWDWLRALPMIERFVARARPVAIDRLWGRLRLAAALMHGKNELHRSLELLEGVVRETRPDHYPLVRLEALNFLAQNHYLLRDWRGARATLSSLDDMSEGNDPMYALVVRQWRALVTLQQPGADPRAARRELRSAREGFVEMGRYFSVRSCDFYLAKTTRDPRRLAYLFYSTPYPGFRGKLLEAFGCDDSSVPAFFDWRIGTGRSGPSFVLDVRNGRANRGSAALKPGQLPQRLLEALALDFYKPPNVVELHERLYPGEFYRPSTSPHRVHEAARRLRAWFSSSRVPLELTERSGLYRLASESDVAIRLPKPGLDPASPKAEPKTSDLVERLRGNFGGREFGSTDAAELVGISRNSAIASLTEASALGLLERLGAGRSTRYRCK